MQTGNIDACMYARYVDLQKLLEHRSLLLLGPRQTGKSTLLRSLFPEAPYFDLLEADTYRRLSAHPEYLRQTLSPEVRLVVIDEVQKIPELLDEVHLLIERNRSLRFVLTGSSARKLKRGRANLLAGRAWTARLHPLVTPELGRAAVLDRMNRGGLPGFFDSEVYEEDLRAYVGTYLQEEIQAEGLSRAIGNFSRFLEVAGLTNGEQLNFTKVGSDAGVPPRTIREYYQVLDDTLVAYQLPAYQATVRRKPVAKSKFYLFDLGVARILARQASIVEGSAAYGRALEHLVFLELRAFLDYTRRDEALTYWRSRSQLEVDFVVGNDVAVEVKAGGNVGRRDCKGLLALAEEVPLRRKLIVCREPRRRVIENGIEVVPIEDFLQDLWGGRVVSRSPAHP